MKLIFIILLLHTLLQASMGSVTAISGEAELLRTNKEVPVVKGLKISEKDRISTAIHSRVQVILNDDTVVTIGPQSIYMFEHYSDEGDGEVTMQIERGFFKTVTGKIGKVAPQKFKIKTKAATIGIRGTQFMAYVQEGEEVIGCIQGEIIVWTDEGKFYVVAGKMIVYRNKHWTIKDMDMGAFSPVMIGMYLEQQAGRLAQTKSIYPQNDYQLEEQIIKKSSKSTLPNKEVAFAMTSKEDDAVPTFLNDTFIVNPFTPNLDPFLFAYQADDTVPRYLLQENVINNGVSPLDPFLFTYQADDTIYGYLLQENTINNSVSPLDPFSADFNSATLDDVTSSFLLQEQVLDSQTPISEPYDLGLETEPSTTLPEFSP